MSRIQQTLFRVYGSYDKMYCISAIDIYLTIIDQAQAPKVDVCRNKLVY